MSSSSERQSQGLAEISESAATGSVAAIYGDIRAALGVDLVNLIYRHLATVPDALEWAWANLGPRFRSGEIDAQADLLRKRVQQTVGAWPKAFNFASSHPTALAGAALVAQVYNLNNSRNLMAFRHLLDGAIGGTFSAALAENAPRVAHSTRPAIPAAPTAANALPPIPSWESISADDRETVLRVNRLGEPSQSGEPGSPAIVASLYRHLALWPAVLGDVESALVQIDVRGDIARALAFAVDSSRTIAQAHPLAMSVPAPAAVDPALRKRIRSFVDITIPKMVPVGLALEAALAVTQATQRDAPCT